MPSMVNPRNCLLLLLNILCKGVAVSLQLRPLGTGHYLLSLEGANQGMLLHSAVATVRFLGAVLYWSLLGVQVFVYRVNLLSYAHL